MRSAASTMSVAHAGARFTPLQWRVVSLCALVGFLEGFDTQSLSPAAQTIATDLAIPITRFGLVFSVFQVGFLAGAMLFSPLGDRFGTPRVLVLCTALFALLSLATTQVGSLEALLAVRLVAGLGLGGASSNYLGLAASYSPPAVRARVVTLLWAAIPLGGVAAGYVSAVVIPAFGWRALFVIGGTVPLMVAVILALCLPRGGGAGRPAVRAQPIAELFRGGRGWMTVWLWLASLLLWTALITFMFWTPSLLQRAGWSMVTAAWMLGLNNTGGVLGTVLVGVPLTRVAADRALLLTLALGGVLVAAMGWSLASETWLAVTVVAAGFCQSAAAGAIVAVSAGIYPAAARATGIGWALGVGRIGSVLGPIGAGMLVGAGWPGRDLYGAFGAAFLLAACFVLLLGRQTARSGLVIVE